MKKILLLLLVLVGLNTSVFGWATVATTVTGGDTIMFNSNVENVDVLLNDKIVGKISNSSFEFKVQRDGEAKVFTFKKSGYKSQEITLTTKLSTLFWLNILGGGGPFGSSTDSWFTNNAQEYSPNQFYVSMEKN